MRFNTVLGVAVAVLLRLKGSFCQLDVCGQAPLNTKMTSRATATSGSWPWQVNIYQISTGTHQCSGSLINKDWILTATQCLLNTYTYTDIDISDFIINLGHENHQGPNPHEINRTVIQIIRHPNFDLSTLDNNIALLQLSSSVTFTDYIRPVCLAAAGSVFDEGLSSWVTGWGGAYGGSYADTDDLLETEVPVVSNPNCSTIWNYLTITDNMLCAGILNYTGNSRCAGDSGGPLVIKQGSQWIQSGITSFTNGYVCNPASTRPIVFTRVSQYQEWINTQIASDQPGFVEFPQSTPDPTPPYIPDPTPIYIPDPTPFIPDIFSGSSLSLHSYPVSLTFPIISLIFCLFMKVV
ncbi:chymotrypsin-like protease CTRL-1 [Misgurnus anguillicaudatus]|uniref:chymotrypsin-like protease CTRL-1 n=1 Tax=Misgurnus anguillicaudatus TaxID=75329 RepID=UPI003CCFB42A